MDDALRAAAIKVCEAQARWLKDETGFPGYAEDVNDAIEALRCVLEETE